MEMVDWMSVLMAHLIRCPDTITIVSGTVEHKDVEAKHGFTMALLWTLSRDYYSAHGTTIPQAFLEAKVREFAGDTWLLNTSEADLRDFIGWVYSIDPVDFNCEEATDYAHRLLVETRLTTRLQEAVLEGCSSDKLVEIVADGTEQSNVGGIEVIDPLFDIDNFAGVLPPEPLGGAEVQYFNKLCGGGIRPGEVALLIGPTGGFKTTMAVDVCCAMANVQEPSMYITYEQAFRDGDLPMRFLARLSGIDRTRLESTRIADLNPDEQKLVREAQTRSHFIQFIDRSKNCDPVSAVSGIVKASKRKGMHPKVVFIDQMLQWIEPWPKNKDDRPDTLIRDTIQKVKQEIASHNEVAGVILHQLTANLAGGSSTRIPKHNDSADCKSICFWADFGIVMGNLNEDAGVFWVVNSKHRRGCDAKLLIRPDVQHYHLMSCEDVEVTRNGDFAPKGSAATRVTPALSGPKKGASVLGKGDV